MQKSVFVHLRSNPLWYYISDFIILSFIVLKSISCRFTYHAATLYLQPWLSFSKTTSCRFILVGQILLCYITYCYIIIPTQFLKMLKFSDPEFQLVVQKSCTESELLWIRESTRSCLFLPVVLRPTSQLIISSICIIHMITHAQVSACHCMDNVVELSIPLESN